MANEVVGINHLATAPNDMYEPMRTNAFRFIIPDVDGLVSVVDGEPIANASERLEFSVVSAPFPTFTQQVIPIRRGNSVMKVAGVPTFDAGTLTIKDYMGADAKAILMSWQNLSYNVKNQTVGLMSKYKKDCYLLEYSPDFSKIVHQWVLHRCWVSSIKQDDYNVENGNERNVTATIEYDYSEIVGTDN